VSMIIVAIKLTEEPSHIKVVYEKDGSLFIRSGADGFEKGIPAQTSLKAIVSKWGFTKVQSPPHFEDADELIDNLDKFGMKPDGTVVFSN